MRKYFLYLKSLPRLILVYARDKILLGKPAVILTYHSVDFNKEFFTVRPGNFERQINYLLNNGYKIKTLSELVSCIRENKIPKKTAVLTFDDGYEDNYLNVFPILKKYNLPATIFLMTGFIGRKDYTNRGIKLPMLDWVQIKEMHNSGLVDFEPHTASHPKLSRLGRAEIEKELTESKREIEEKLNKECRFFAYPKGDYNDEALSAVKKYFEAALSMKKGFTSTADNIFLLKRNSVDCLADKLRFRLKI